MRSLALNLIIALVWLLLGSDPSAITLGVGFLIGFAFLAAFRAVLGSEPYVRSTLAFFWFLLVFAREFAAANVKVAWTILARGRATLHPNFLTYDVTGMTRPEIVLLSYCISLTPGTTMVQISEDFRTLVLHALDADDPDAIRASIDRKLRQNILAFTR